MATVVPASAENHPSGPTARQREVWEAVERLGSQTAAARGLHMKQGSIQSALKGYMARMGIKGELPGKLSPEAKHKAIVAGAHAGGFNGAPIGMIRGDRVVPAMPAAETETEPDSDVTAADVPPVPIVAADLAEVVRAGSDEAPYTHTFTPASSGGVDFEVFDPIVWGSLYWLAEHAHNWTQDQAEKWLRSFTAALDLAYPPAA